MTKKKIYDFMDMDDIKLFAKMKQNGRLIQTIVIHS